MSQSEFNLKARIEIVEERIQRAAVRAGRPRADIVLVAVSKKFSAQAICAAYEAGLRDFGENYVQEFGEKSEHLAGLSEARFHCIGHLQSNKAKLACRLFRTIHTADSVRLLNRLDAAAAELGVRPDVLLEMKLSGEDTKTGALPGLLPELLNAAASLGNISVCGLMTIPPWSVDEEVARPYFRQLAGLAASYRLPQLSMGMSNDFEAAIEEGATLIRVGTAIFGARPKPNG